MAPDPPVAWVGPPGAPAASAARWPALPEAPPTLVDEALDAVRAEQRGASRAIRLEALAAAEDPRSPGIYRVDVGELCEADASWEGARAFKPADLDDAARLLAGEHLPQLRETRWSGEVVAVDEAAAALWVAVEPGADAPCTGAFLVLPFDFLRGLTEVLDHGDPGWRAALSRALLAALAGPPSSPNELESPAQGSEPMPWHARPWACLWGPPGTGKTWTLGHEAAARALAGERLLVVSTTNRATDGAALHIGHALSEPGQPARAATLLERHGVQRVGWGADVERFESESMLALLDPKGLDARRALARAVRARAKARSAAERARWGVTLGELRAQGGDELRRAFGRRGPRVVVATIFAAVRALSDADLRGWLEVHGGAFDRVLIDEAGLVSRATAAALSLWARRGVLLIGDPRQLAPIARQHRVLAPSRGRWIGESGLDFLERPVVVDPEADAAPPDGVRQLTAQHRMHPTIRAVVSDYQYEGQLSDAEAVLTRAEPPRDLPLTDQPRALWLVVDTLPGDPVRRRATRGPAQRSWLRPATLDALATLLDHLPSAAAGSGLVISPYRAHARAAERLLRARRLGGWRASTVHAQQGAEADNVVFDTVRAASTAWPAHEWRRLVNVALSRSRTQVVLIAGRDEMRQPWLRPLVAALPPRALKLRGGRLQLVQTDGIVDAPAPLPESLPPHSLGRQLAERRVMRPLTSAVQERLCRTKLDGGPRLVRGVAGSGKTWILATWVARTLADPERSSPGPGQVAKVWLVFGNHGLRPLLWAHVREAWEAVAPGRRFPSERLAVVHVQSLLQTLLRERGEEAEGFDYEAHARRWLTLQGDETPEPRCDALFVDEAQDMGPDVLRALFSFVRPWDPSRPRRRAVHVFYDNDQNVFGRSTPVWSELGLDMRGRATVLETSFRSTRPIVSFARNLRWRLHPPRRDADHTELIRRGLIVQGRRRGQLWWEARYAEAEGPAPRVRTFAHRDAELDFLAETLARWLGPQAVAPEDVVVLVNGPERARVVARLQAGLAHLPEVRVQEQRSRGLELSAGVLRVTTAHSFKGHEAEVAVVACADTFVAGGQRVPCPGVHGALQPLVAPLYVALTRARSMLLVTGLAQPHGEAGRAIVQSLSFTAAQQREGDVVSPDLPRARLLTLLAERLGDRELRSWLVELDERMTLTTEPVFRPDGRLLCAPVVQLQAGRSRWVVLPDPGPDAATRAALRSLGVGVLRPGADAGGQLGLGL